MAQQIVVDSSQAHERRLICADLLREILNRSVEVEQHRARVMVSHHRLYPEEACDPLTTRDGGYAVYGRGGVKDQIPRCELHRRMAVGDQFATVIFVRAAKEERR